MSAVFVGRRQDNSIYGVWANQQWEGQEELPDDHPEVVAFLAPVAPTADQLEEQCKQALNGGAGPIDLRKLIKAKFISDLAFRLGKAPGALTAGELTTERNRLAAIYKAL